jgi:hypothetical protein
MNIRISLTLLLLAEDDDTAPAVLDDDDDEDVGRLSAVRDILRLRNRGGVLAIISSRFAFINSSFRKCT